MYAARSSASAFSLSGSMYSGVSWRPWSSSRVLTEDVDELVPLAPALIDVVAQTWDGHLGRLLAPGDVEPDAEAGDRLPDLRLGVLAALEGRTGRVTAAARRRKRACAGLPGAATQTVLYTLLVMAEGTPRIAVDGRARGVIASEFVRLHSECYGRGPTKAKVYADGELLAVVLEETFTVGEKTLIEHGHAEGIQDIRRRFQQVMADQFKSAVEQATGRSVRAFMSETHLESDMSVEIFLLAEPRTDMTGFEGDQPS